MSPIAPVFSPELNGFSGLLHFAKDPLGALEEARAKHGPLVEYRQGPADIRLVFDAQLSDELLVKHADAIEKDEFTRMLKPILGLGLLTNEGAPWRARRKLMAPSFQPRQIRGYASTMVACAKTLIARMETDGVRNINQDMMELTLDIVVQAIFGTGAVRTAEVGELLEVAMADYRRLTMSFRAAFPKWFPFYSRYRFARARNKLRRIVDEVIAARLGAPLTDDMLSRLMEARDDEGNSLTREDLLDESLTVMLAGHETTALALTFTLHLLTQNPEVTRALQAEVAQVLGGRDATMEDAPQLKVTRGVIRESMRLYPPVWATGRETMRDITVQGVELKKGTQLMLSPWIAHRDTTHYKEPLAFRPERWWNGETEGLPRGAYFPFGGGPRVCIGQHFAEMEAQLVLATLIQNCEFEALGPEAVRLAPSVTLRTAEPLHLRVRLRTDRSQAAA